MVASWTDDGPSAVTQRVRHGCQRSRHATGVSRGPNTGLSLSTLTASGCHGLASTGEPPLAAVKLERIRRREAADAYAMRTRVAYRSAGCRRCKESFAAARAIVSRVLYIRPGSRLRVWGAAHRCLARRQTACVAWPKLRASRRREVS